MMGGGTTTSILTLYLGGIFSVFALCAGKDLCQHNKQQSFKDPTISRLNDRVNITLEIETDDFYILNVNGSMLYTKSHSPANININATHFTLVTSCVTGAGSYMLQTATHQGTACHYFNVTNCLSDLTSTHLAQSSCSECEYAISTITQFVIIIFYSIF
nr:membrane glycoprotein E51 [Elephant endotheliotropic herpesvirus 1A]